MTVKIPYKVVDDDKEIATATLELEDAEIIDELEDIMVEGDQAIETHIDAFIHDKVVEDFEREFGPEVDDDVSASAVKEIRAVLVKAKTEAPA